MKRLLMLATLPLAAVLIFSQGSAQSQTDPVRGFTERVTNTTTPTRDRTRPYTFTTTGRIVPPATFCAPNVRPTPTANCVPLICPAGATDARYCARPSLNVICAGRVTVRVQRRTTTISARTVSVRPNCTYRSRVSFRLRLPTRRGSLRVRARFAGNVVLQPRNSPTRIVRAG